ncbi:glycosyltransferase [Candidatus Poribacteria bacterium]|nr:glycosyltransferase [Candidatus Poribacteria bacterium]
MSDQIPNDEIARTAQSTYDAFIRAPAARAWLRKRKAICFYGLNQLARNVQIHGLQDAARTWKIPFYYVAVGTESRLEQVVAYDDVLFLTTLDHVPVLAPHMARCNGRIALIAGNYDGSPSPATVKTVTDDDARLLDEHRDYISVALTEYSSTWAERYYRGYVAKHGIPVMSFTWGINLVRHFPADVAKTGDLVFAGSYFEKTPRIDDYFGPAFSKFSHTVLGFGWSSSPYGIGDVVTREFNTLAPVLYSGHTVSLNVHHAHEEAGHTCNERCFNVPACGGFMVSDYAPRIRDFFPEDEAVVADGPSDFLDKVEHFVRYPDERIPYMQKARRRVVAEHTYHHRLCDLLRFVINGDTVFDHCPVMTVPPAT